MKMFRYQSLLLALCLLSVPSPAATIILNSDQTDYTFQSGNTYYLTNSVTVYGTATFQTNVVLKVATNLWNPALTVGEVDFQTTPDLPAIFTSCDDDRFGEVLPGSTHVPSSVHAIPALKVESASDTVNIHDAEFYYFDIALQLVNNAQTDSGCQNADLWNIFMQDCGLGIDCSSENFSVTNLTMIDCGGIVDDYNPTGVIVDSTFINNGGFVSDTWGYFFNDFTFRWCVFSNSSLDSFEVNVHGDHNGFANCSQFHTFDYYSGEFFGTNYFGDNWYWLSNSIIEFTLSSTNYYINHQVVPVQINLTTNGVVFYQALLVGSTDFDSATWNTFTTTNLSVDLGGLTNKVYDVWVGLYGARDYAPVWQKIQFEMDTNPPVLKISSPTNSTSGIPLLQVLGEANEGLSSLSFDLSNAVSYVTNEQGLVLNRFFDTNQWNFTTNYFQCFACS